MKQLWAGFKMKKRFFTLLVSQAFLQTLCADDDFWENANYQYSQSSSIEKKQSQKTSEAVLNALNEHKALMNVGSSILQANPQVQWSGNYQVAGSVLPYGTIQPWISGTTTTNWSNNTTPQPTDDTVFTTSANSGFSDVWVYVNVGGSPSASSYANSLSFTPSPTGTIFNIFGDQKASGAGSGVNSLYISPINANGITVKNGTVDFFAIDLNMTTGTVFADTGANIYFGTSTASVNTNTSFTAGTAGANLYFAGVSGTTYFIGTTTFNFNSFQNININSGNFVVNATFSTLFDTNSVNFTIAGGTVDVQACTNFANTSNGVNITGGVTNIAGVSGSVFSPQSIFGIFSGTVVINGGTCANNTPSFVMEGGYLSLDAASSLGSGGTTSIAFVGGTLVNNGTIFAGDSSYFAINPQTFTEGSVLGTGQIASNGFLSITIPVTQATVSSLNGVLDGTGPINATVSVTSGFLKSGDERPTHMSILQSLLLNNATSTIYVAREDWTEFNVTNQVQLTGTNPIKVDELNAHWRNTQRFPIFTYASQVGGSFTGPVSDSKYYSYLDQTPTATYLVVDFPPPIAIFNGNIARLAGGLNQVSGECTPGLQNIIDELGFLPLETQKVVLNQMLPQFKLIQYSQEKLFYSLQDEVKLLGVFQKQGPRVFVKAGYDYYHQDPKTQFNGFHINSFYQMAGLSYGMDNMSYAGAIGASESYFNFEQFPAHANYDSVYASFSALGKKPHFEWGLSGTYGMSFIRTYRRIDYFNELAKSAHNAWMGILEGDLGYVLRGSYASFKVYDRLGFVYGKENTYRENHADALNLVVKNEALFYLRNTLGLYFDFFSKDHYKGYLDTAWVYERPLHTNTYTYRFTGEKLYIKDVPLFQTPNYAKIGVGFEGQFKPVDFQLNYHVLFNRTFVEHNASVMLGKQF
jgi:hypothetical protein